MPWRARPRRTSPSSLTSGRPCEKLRAYQQIDSLVEYLLINQEKREVEIHRRTPQGWVRDILEPGDACTLASVGLELALDQIYEDSGVLS